MGLLLDILTITVLLAIIPISIYWNWKDKKEVQKIIEKEDAIRKNAKKKEGK